MRFILVLFLFFGASANAQSNHFHVKGEFDFGLNLNQVLNLPDYHSGLGIGLNVGMIMHENIRLELSSNFNKVNIGGVGVISNNQIGITGMTFMNKFNKLIPFAGLGLEYHMNELVPLSYLYLDRSNDIINDSNFGINALVGARYFLSDGISVQCQIKYVQHIDKNLNYIFENSTVGNYVETNVVTIESQLYSDLVLNVGFNYKLNSKK